jgi:[pyruvate, water dikinase]-phosphate phosphotransferase / [pyruvate, water dikinase] kinase
MKTHINIHLVSDSTGETVHQVARASLAQFNHVETSEYIWTLVRSSEHVTTVSESLTANPGLVLHSIMDETIRAEIIDVCTKQNIPNVAILDPVVDLLSDILGHERNSRPGGQHRLDRAYFDRMGAVEFAVTHDDGLNIDKLDDAQILLVGVSRTSKTPTSMYLAHRGYRVANYALVPHVPFPLHHIADKSDILVVGLTTDASRLARVRRNRLRHMAAHNNEEYADLASINRELSSARALFTAQDWPILDVSNRSVEETAAAIIQLHTERNITTS